MGPILNHRSFRIDRAAVTKHPENCRCRPHCGKTSDSLISGDQSPPQIITMPPRLNLFAAHRAASALRSSPVSVTSRSIALPLRFQAAQTPAQKRWKSSNDEPKNIQPDEQKFPTQDPLPSVSEEAAEVSSIMEKEKSCDGQPSSPELEQGTPVSEVSLTAYPWRV